MKIEFCASCGQVALRGFAYCPYCGVSLRPGPGAEETFRSFTELESMQVESQERRIEELLAVLDGIESDVDAILDSGA